MNTAEVQYGHYYRASAISNKIWLIVSLLKSLDNVAYHRTVDGTNDELEFSVPASRHKDFIMFMEHCVDHHYITSFHEAPRPARFS